MFESQVKTAKKAMYAGIGMPIVMTRKFREMADEAMDRGTRLVGEAREQYATFAKEGEKATKELRDSSMVEEFQSRVDLDNIQTQVEKLRDQLETSLVNWRESFTPATAPKTAAATKPAATATATPARKPAAKKPAAKTTAARKPAAKKPAAKTTAAKTTAARKPAAKKTAAKTTAAKTTAARKPAAKKPATKTATASK